MYIIFVIYKLLRIIIIIINISLIREAPNSNLGPKTRSNKTLRGVPPSLRANSGIRKYLSSPCTASSYGSRRHATAARAAQLLTGCQFH